MRWSDLRYSGVRGAYLEDDDEMADLHFDVLYQIVDRSLDPACTFDF